MKDLINKFEPADCIAVVALVFSFTLLAFGVDHVVPAIITMIAGYYFGHKRKAEDNVLQNPADLPTIDESQ